MNRDFVQQLATSGVLVALAILIPWVILYAVVLGASARWASRQWACHA